MKLLFTFLLLVAPGCARLIILKEGLKQPAIEDYQSLSTFLLKKQIDTSELLCLRDTHALNQYYKRSFSLPSSRFFNRNGELVDYRDSPEDCNGKVAEFIKKAETINQRQPVAGERLDWYVKDLVYVKDRELFEMEKEAYDFYLLIYWAKYLGNVNKTKVFDWLTLVDNARKRGLKIRVLKINADYQKAWGLQPEDLPHFDYR